MIKKWFVAILFLLAGFIGHSQTKPVGLPVPYAPTGFYRVAWVKSDSGLIGPMKDTTYLPRFTGTITFRPQDRQPYYYDSTTLLWNKFLLGPDTSSLSTRINSKLFLSDTASMLDPYLHYNDTTNRWTQDIYSRNDSLFKVKNGVELFIDTIGGGGGGGDGTVTSVGMTVPSAFNVSTSSITTSGTFNISGAGTTGQYIRGNGTLATTDTSMITNFYIKSRGLLSGSSPITYNNFTGAFGINNANTSGTKGAASFVNGSFSDNGSGLIDLATVTTAGSCTNCNVTYDAKGRATSYANGTGGSGSNTRRSVIKATLDSIQLVNDVSESPELGKVFKYAIDSTGENRGYVEEQYYVSKQVSEFRSLRTADTSLIYRTIINGVVSDFYWDTLSTADDDSVMCIKINSITTGRLLRYITWFVSPDWFGAKPDDGVDDSYAVQKAIDYALASSKAPTVLFSGGNYRCNNINVVNRVGIEYSFVTLKLMGSSFLVNSATTITVNNANGFGFQVMIGRQVEFENLNFVGQSPAPSGFTQVITWTDGQWTSGVRNNRYSPHAAIVIDGYYSGIGSSDQYPGMSDYYTNFQTGGTSQLTILNCTFKRFVVGILEGAAGSIANGDNIKAENCYFENNKVAWGCGQTQSRANSIENCYFLFHQYIVDGVSYGNNQGTPPSVIRCNFAGATKYLFFLNGSFSAMTFQECYSESLFSLGKCAGAPIQFTDCEFIMVSESAFIAPHVAEGDQMTFKGGRFGYFDNVSRMATVFNVKNLNFDAVSLLSLPVNMHPNIFAAQLNKTNYNNCRFIGANQVGDVWSGNHYGTIEISNAFGNAPVIMPGSKYIFENESKKIVYESVSPKVEYFVIEDTTLNIDSVTHTAYFISESVDAYQENDILVTFGNNVSWSGDQVNFTATPSIIGEVYDISGDTVRLKYVPFGLDESTMYNITQIRVPHIVPKFFGDITNGSNQITNALFGLQQPQVGNWIKGAGIPDATRITDIVGTTITMSRDATATSSVVEFNDAQIRTTGYAADISVATQGRGYSIGDIVYNTFAESTNDTIAYWVYTGSGFTSGTPAATYTYVKTGPTSGSGNVSGSGANTQVTYWTGTNTITGSNSLTWDDAAKRFTIQNGTTSAQFSVAGGILNIGGLQTITIPDTTQVLIGPVNDGTTPDFGIQSALTTTYMTMRNDINSAASNVVRAIKSRGGSFNLNTGDVVFDIQANTLCSYQIVAGTGSFGSFKLVDHKWGTAFSDGNEYERMRITWDGSVLVNTSSSSTDVRARRFYVNGSIGANKDSVDFQSTIDTRHMLVIDTATGKFQRMTIPSASGITTLNSLTASTQTFATGTSGSDFNISSSSSTHTFNIPTASGSNRGLLSTSDWTTFNNKVGSINSQTGATQTIVSGSSFLTVNSASNTHTISVDADYLTSDTYTPTLTNVSNIGASTAFVCQYTVVGDMVTVSGEVDIDPSATGTIQLGISLPVSTAFAGSNELGGTAVAGAVEGLNASIRADATNERAELIGTLPVASSIANNKWHFIFMYKISGT